MTGRQVRVVIVTVAVVILGSAIAAAVVPAAAKHSVAFGGEPTRTGLDDGWSIQSSLAVDASPEAVSRPGFFTDGWYPVTLPSTVLAGLVANDEYENLYVGTNLESVWEPRFEVPWWYRTEFKLDDLPGARTQLHFDGINYRAGVYVNGELIAGSDRVGGAFRTYAFDVTDVVHPGANALAVRVYPVDANHDLTITWVDWSPLAPDHGMGIWHDVWLTRTGAVTVRDPQVVSDLPLPDTDHADLSVTATVRNAGDAPVIADLAGTIGTTAFSRSVALDPGESQLVTFDAASYPQLRLTDPPLWWPYQMGDQPLEELTVTASVHDVESDRASTSFGIREVASEYMPNGARRFLINGEPILIRGGGWASDMLLRPVPQRVDVQKMYVKALQDARWPNPILASSSDDSSTVLGRTGVKMTGPYDWVPPLYWYDPRADGGAEGFNTERGSTWFFTPTETYADFTALSDLPNVRPTVEACDDTSAAAGTMKVTVTNDSDDVAFFVRLRLTAGPNGNDVTPVTWSDGYVTLMPGEEQTLTASYRTSDLHGMQPSVEISGWNVLRSRPAIELCA